MIVMKFGGSSVATADRIRHVAGIIKSFEHKRPIVVLSAMGDTADDLLSAAEEACSVGAWGPTALVTDAVSSMGTTATRTIGRDSCGTKKEDTNTAEDWLICPTSKASPGADNYNHPLL